MIPMKWTLPVLSCVMGAAHAGDFVFFDSFETLRQPVAGSVIVTEIMSNPTLVADLAGEWFELANVSDQSVDLGDCAVSQNATSNVLPSHQLPPGGFAVVARNTDPVSNGNVTAFATFTFGLAASGSITLSCGSRVIDAVTWPNESAGHSRSLYPNYFNAIDNDDAVFHWCFTAQAMYNGSDYGTPNAANETCAAG